MSEDQARYEVGEQKPGRDCDSCNRPERSQACPMPWQYIEDCLGSPSRLYWRPKPAEDIADICKECLHHIADNVTMCAGCGPDNDNYVPVDMERSRAFTNQRNPDHAPKNTALENKPKPSLIPFDICMEFDEPAYQEGLIKYSRESWRKGFPISEMYDAAVRHLEQFFYRQQNYDPDAEKLGIKKHHLAGARFSIACMLQTLRDHPEMDDRGELFGKKETESE